MVKVDFQFDTNFGLFADCLVFEDDAVPSLQEIEAMKHERLNAWMAFVSAPPAPDTVTIDGVTYEKITVNGQVVLKPLGA